MSGWMSGPSAKSAARKIEFVERSQSDLGCPAPREKIFLFSPDPTQIYISPVPSHSEGRLAIVMNAGRDAVDAAASSREVSDHPRGRTTSYQAKPFGEAGSLRTVKTCGPGTPTLVSSSQAIPDDGGKKARPPRRERYKP